VTPLSPDFKDELVKLVVKKLGYTSDDLNQEQLDEVHEFSKLVKNQNFVAFI
jgi:hypothetical protein